MTTTKNWHNIIMNVQNANLDKQTLQSKIKRYNKRAYKQQLDRQVQLKKTQNLIRTTQKIKERQQAKKLAQIQNLAKIKQKYIKSEIEKKYGEQNLSLLDIQERIRSLKNQQERVNIERFLQHPFVKLIDQENKRKDDLKKKFIIQNQINHLQQQMKTQKKNTIRFKEAQEKSQFVDYIQQTHQKRSQQRERFKNKYLKIKKGQYQQPAHHNNFYLKTSNQQTNQNQNYNQDTSVQKMYINYLNKQMKTNHQKKVREKNSVVDDQRLEKFYQNNQEPNSSPAYLGRNPLSYERRRQLYYIDKHLNTTHQRSLTTDVYTKIGQKANTSVIKPLPNYNQFNRVANSLNPEQINMTRNNPNHSMKQKSNINHTQSAIIRPFSNGQYNLQKQAPHSTKLLKVHQSSQRKQNYLFNNNRQNLNNFKQVPDSHRRIKSQLVEENLDRRQQPESYNSQHKQFEHQHQQNQQQQRYQQNRYRSNHSVKTQNAPIRPKREYLKYDVLTGKYMKCFF